MSIDPRTMAQLIKLQLLNSTGVVADADNRTAIGGNDDFMQLLQSFLDESTAGRSGSVHDGNSPVLTERMRGALQAGTASYDARRVQASGGSESEAVAFDPYIRQASERYGIPQHLVKAVIDAESSFNPHAVSSAGAKGLMQLMDETGQGLGVTDPFNPEQNIQAGTRFLAGLLHKYKGNTAVALAAYNAGPGKIDSLGIATDQELADNYVRLPKETQSYVRKVLRLQQQYI
jgi:membrane-bound lytic murein transglycosylase MltF